jgi:hypothetical protein
MRTVVMNMEDWRTTTPKKEPPDRKTILPSQRMIQAVITTNKMDAMEKYSSGLEITSSTIGPCPKNKCVSQINNPVINWNGVPGWSMCPILPNSRMEQFKPFKR